MRPILRPIYKVPLILNGSYTRETASEAVRNRMADTISSGRPYIPNSDLPERFRLNAPLKPGRCLHIPCAEIRYSDSEVA